MNTSVVTGSEHEIKKVMAARKQVGYRRGLALWLWKTELLNDMTD